MAMMKATVLGVRKGVQGKKNPSKYYNFARLMDNECPAGSITEILVGDDKVAALEALQRKAIVAEIFLDGKYVNLGQFKAA